MAIVIVAPHTVTPTPTHSLTHPGHVHEHRLQRGHALHAQVQVLHARLRLGREVFEREEGQRRLLLRMLEHLVNDLHSATSAVCGGSNK
jgi:hypothetical protein